MSTYTIPYSIAPDVFFDTLPSDATEVIFEGGHPISQRDLVLPARKIVIDGKGCSVGLGQNSNGFTVPIASQQDANSRIESKYVIRNFSNIYGGKKAIDLAASIGSRIEDVECTRQSEAAIDLRFCLMAHVHDVKITLPYNDGIRVRNGDWEGAGVNNSQSNSATLERVRVYNGPTAKKAFTFQHANSGRMEQCVSEGYGPDYDLWLDASNGLNAGVANNTVVKQFACDGFHVEHGGTQAKQASVWVNMPSKCVVSLRQCYWNYVPNRPIIEYTMGQVILSEIGWWSVYHYISSRIQSPRITVRDCHNDLTKAANVTNNRCGSFRLSEDPVINNTTLTPAYVSAQNPSQ